MAVVSGTLPKVKDLGNAILGDFQNPFGSTRSHCEVGQVVWSRNLI